MRCAYDDASCNASSRRYASCPQHEARAQGVSSYYMYVRRRGRSINIANANPKHIFTNKRYIAIDRPKVEEVLRPPPPPPPPTSSLHAEAVVQTRDIMIRECIIINILTRHTSIPSMWYVHYGTRLDRCISCTRLTPSERLRLNRFRFHQGKHP